MTRTGALAIALILASPAVALAQGASTQSRDGLGTGSHPTDPSNGRPAGGVNAETGPQAHPAYSSGSDTPNPGAAMVRTTPVPATGPAQTSPGSVSTTTTAPDGSTSHSAAPGVGEPATPAR